MSDRHAMMDAFIADAGWGDATRTDIPGDASTRSYSRLALRGRKAVLMNAPKGAEAPGEPDGASPADRRALGYNAVARLAGPKLEAFLTIANELSMRGFSAPHIIAADLEHGFALLEDLGNGDFARTLRTDPDLERDLYEAAVDTLAAIHRSSFPAKPTYKGATWPIRVYDELALLAETDLLLDWYAADAGREIGETARAELHDLWRDAFQTLSAHAPGLALRDFHAENLFWLPERDGEARVGLIDFQDALMAHPAYDLVSLIEDARRDVDPSLTEPLKARFFDRAGLTDRAAFDAAYAVMGAQRNAKILGIFVRLAERDGKPHYRALIPRVANHFRSNLAHPACADLRRWFADNLPEVLS